MAKNDHFSEKELRSTLRKVAHEWDENGDGYSILYHDSENIRRLREFCRLSPDKSVYDVATEMIPCFEVL